MIQLFDRNTTFFIHIYFIINIHNLLHYEFNLLKNILIDSNLDFKL